PAILGDDFCRPTIRSARSSGTPARSKSESCWYVIASLRTGRRVPLRRCGEACSSTWIGVSPLRSSSWAAVRAERLSRYPRTRLPVVSKAVYRNAPTEIQPASSLRGQFVTRRDHPRIVRRCPSIKPVHDLALAVDEKLGEVPFRVAA